MKAVHRNAMIGGAAALAAIAAVAFAAAPQDARKRSTPQNWTYEIDKDGKRVPRVERKVNPDGSWTEEYRAGNCTVTRTGKAGEVRETRKCD